MGTTDTTTPFAEFIQSPAHRFPHPFSRKSYDVDVLLEETKLRKLLNDPLYPAYLARALSAEFVTAVDVLRAFAKVVPELQAGQQFQRYPILRILSQAIALWRPSPAILPKDVQLVWEIEQILHRQETLGQDQVLFMEIMDAWNELLTSQSIRPILKSEKKKDTGNGSYCVR